MKKKYIYNLEFPDYVYELNIGEYKFKRINNYEKAFQKLQHTINSSGEFDTKANNGQHQITAIIDIPEKEKLCVLPWENKKYTQLYDILLLLSLFTKRNVFVKDWKGNLPIISDCRTAYYGGELRTSMSKEHRYIDRFNHKIYTEQEVRQKNLVGLGYVNTGFEKSINDVFNLICSKEWQEKYEGGYFLFLFKQAVQRQIIETSFILCWTIWEHLFSLSTRKWLDKNAIEQLSGDNKIAYIMSKYFKMEINQKARQQIIRIKNARNKIIHFGKKPENVDYEEMNLFNILTEQLIVMILGLTPSNILNSFEKLKEVLDGRKIKGWLNLRG